MRLPACPVPEMAALAQFGSDLDKATQAQLAKGGAPDGSPQTDQYEPLPVEKQVAIIFAANEGFLDDLAPADCGSFEKGLYEFLRAVTRTRSVRVREERKLGRFVDGRAP